MIESVDYMALWANARKRIEELEEALRRDRNTIKLIDGLFKLRAFELRDEEEGSEAEALRNEMDDAWYSAGTDDHLCRQVATVLNAVEDPRLIDIWAQQDSEELRKLRGDLKEAKWRADALTLDLADSQADTAEAWAALARACWKTGIPNTDNSSVLALLWRPKHGHEVMTIREVTQRWRDDRGYRWAYMPHDSVDDAILALEEDEDDAD